MFFKENRIAVLWLAGTRDQSTMRLFYALMPSKEVIAALQEMMGGVAGARWQSAAQLHLTLRFVGEVSARRADELAAALPESMAPLPPFTLSGAGYFESRGHPDSLWVHAMPKEPLARLHHKFDRACQMAGLEPERRAFLPHITVARLSRSAGSIHPWIAQHADFSLSPARFVRCSLVESILTSDGSHYEELASVSLR